MGKFEGALSGGKYEVLYKTVCINSALVGLVGTARMSDFSVVFGQTVQLSQISEIRTPIVNSWLCHCGFLKSVNVGVLSFVRC